MPRDNRRHQPQGDRSKHSINRAITAREVRLISEKGEQLGIVPTNEALQRAEDVGMDLVEVAPEAKPPVCKILDFGKLKYKEQKKAAETRKKSSAQAHKEIRLRYNTDSHDLETKVKQARKFISAGDKVRFQLRFRGREVVYRSLGEEVFDQVIEELSDVAQLEERTPLQGNRMLMSLTPLGAKKPS